MLLIADLAVLVVALLHAWFLILEMFLWERPLGLKTFGHSPEQASATRVLAINQGLYNGFLSAGLIYGVVLGEQGFAFKLFFLICVVIAGVVGAVTASRKIFLVQSLPAIIAMALLGLAG
ncbi:MAG: DUF1304 domain-containing protein [Gammaproteobacteria bacterium]